MVLINNCFLEQYVSVPMVTLALASCNRQECKLSSSIGECDHGTITFNVIVTPLRIAQRWQTLKGSVLK